MLIIGLKYRFTMDEIAEVVLARVTQIQTGIIACNCCGKTKMKISRDTGITWKWAPAANVLDRLKCGQVIDGRLD